ncbi:MAG: type II secretion system minor pseudopilin GspI [Gammaproteobacteria bacterium]|jgi:general secretion pathway protein I|nr:type II secretion system minor pseudopilin GspI [Gammaproteobacteria bacterium]MBT4493280.1 type II secretion system minor pseudopilin GspI [Gammaproteobacteria bacterium]MBT7372034.1 type II secretion system minor pseudopilin GspI [Gammaproteobacteria bacterium]
MRNRGFTLIEVMIALAVFAVVSVALVNNSTSSLRQAGMIQDRTIASWLAENEMTRLRVQPRDDENFPAAGIVRKSAEVANIEWELETHIESTENDYVRRITVRVYRDTANEPVSELIGFLGRY